MDEHTDITVASRSRNDGMLAAVGSRTMREFIRYFAASAVALLVDAGILALLTSYAGVPYLISGAISFVFGIVVNYLLSIRWVFERRTFGDARVEFALFFLIGIVGLFINELVLWFLTSHFGIYYLFSKGISVIIVFLWNFFARKFFLFART